MPILVSFEQNGQTGQTGQIEQIEQMIVTKPFLGKQNEIEVNLSS